VAAIPLENIPAEAQSRTSRELRRADSRAEYRRELRECRRELAKVQRKDNRDWRRCSAYDYNRYESDYRTYHAHRYYRDGSHYRPYTLGRNDRIYRGQDGRYYCRRSDGTTGLIVGAAGPRSRSRPRALQLSAAPGRERKGPAIAGPF